MKKQKAITFLSLVLVTVGILLMLSPQITSWWVGHQSRQNTIASAEIPAATLQENLKREADFDFDAIDAISPTSVLLDKSYIDESLVVGRLIIPSIEMNLTVYNGVSNDILNAGAGTMRPHLTMGEGNFPIAGHYASRKNVLFADLTSVALGDEIFLTDNETTYIYRVYETKVVGPSETQWIEDEVADDRGKPVISLMNCYYVNGVDSGDRYFVFGELVDVKEKL